MRAAAAHLIGGPTAAPPAPARRYDVPGRPVSPPLRAPVRPLACLVVDDHPITRDSLVGMLRIDPRVAEVRSAPDAFEALRLAHGTRVDLAFVEAGLPGMDGIELAWVLKRFATPPVLILLGRTRQRTAEASEVGAVDYLPKPVSQGRLDESLRWAINRRYGPAASRPASDPDNAPTGSGGMMAVPIAGGVKLLRLNAIRWVQAKGDYVRLYTSEGEHLVRASIGWLADRLAALGMVRIHRSYLVQPRLIQVVRPESSGGLVVVIDGHQLPVSRRQASALRTHLGLA